LCYHVVYITASNEEEAHRIGITLVQERLAACVNYFPIQSIYRWQEKINENMEVALLVKTKGILVEKVISRARALHSYETPCIESWKIDRGYSPYLRWIADSTEQE
jgi:periplasmic divalent cation tolerance protein